MKLFDDCSAAEITEAAGTFSMFSEKKVVWVKSYMPLTAVNPRGYTASDRDKILDYINNPNEQTILIFSAEAPEERSELVKELKKNCKTYFFDKLDYSELAAFAEKRFRAEDVFISRETLKYLLDETGYFNKETEYRPNLIGYSSAEDVLVVLSFLCVIVTVILDYLPVAHMVDILHFLSFFLLGFL